MRKVIMLLVCMAICISVPNASFAALSTINVDQVAMNVVKGDSVTFNLTITNNDLGTANNTVLSIEGNPSLASVSSFSPSAISLGRSSTAQVTLTIDTTSLISQEYVFTVKAAAPAISGKRNTGQAASFQVSPSITLTVSEPPPPIILDKPIHYVALGDSLVTGTTGMSGTMKTYVHGIFSHLVNKYGAVNVTKSILGYDGDASEELLFKVTYDSNVRTEILKADIITISIGGNNIMPAAKPSSFWSINTALANQGIINFADDYRSILDAIYDLNPDVTVISTTLYNPYNSAIQPKGYAGDTTLNTIASTYIENIINKSIREYQNNINLNVKYHVVEAHNYFTEKYGSFGKMGEVTFFYPRYSAFTWFFTKYTRDPHLNQWGQDELLKLHIEQLRNFSIVQGSGVSQYGQSVYKIAA